MNNILYIENSAQIGGANRSLLLILDHLDRSNFTPFVACPDNGPMIDELNARNVNHVVIPKKNITLSNPFSFWRVIYKYLSLMRKYDFDLVHANDPAAYLWIGCALRFKNIPAICHVRFPYTREGLQYLSRKTRAPDVAVFNSHHMRNSLKTITDEYWPTTKDEVIHNAVDQEIFHPLSADKELKNSLNIPEGANVVCSIANFTPMKDHETFIKAASLIHKKLPDTHFILAGTDVLFNGERESALKKLARQNDLGENIHFIGFQKDIPRLLSIVDIVLVTSKEEPFGRTVIEALACGKPVIASRVGGIPEILNGVGVLVEPGDAAGFSQQCIALLNPRNRIDGTKYISHIKDNFGIKNHVDKITSVYYSLLQ